MDSHMIEEMLREVKANLRAMEQQHSSIKDERRQQVEIVTAMRAALRNRSDMSAERRALIDEMTKTRKEAEAARRIRDSINRDIPPLLEQIVEQMHHLHRGLTQMHNDLREIPRFGLEREMFRRFFEHQQMYLRKKKAEDAHQTQRDCSLRMREIGKLLDSSKEASEKVVEDGLADVPHANSEDAGWKAVQRISNRIEEIDSLSKEQRRNLRGMRRERGRLEAFLRLQESGRLLTREESFEEVQERALEGGSLTLDDLGALLDRGGLGALAGDDGETGGEDATGPQPSKEPEGHKQESDVGKPRKRSRSTPRRGGPRRHALGREREEVR